MTKTRSKRGTATTLHRYTLQLDIAAQSELSDRRLAALASRMAMLLQNMGYGLWIEPDETGAITITNHSVEELPEGC